MVTYSSSFRALEATEKYTDGASRIALALLEPQLLYVSQGIIRSTWKALPNSTEQKVQRLLQAVERPVVARHAGEKAQVEAQETIRSIVRTQVSWLLPTASMHLYIDS